MENKCLKLISVLLVLVLLVNMLPMSVFAEELHRSTVTETPITAESVVAEDTKIVTELTEKRTAYTKEFLLSNGLRMAAVYPDAVHYETGNGWEEIDNTLKASSDGTYTNTAGLWNVHFPQQLSGAKSVVIEKDGYTLSFAMSGELRSSGELMSARATATAEQLAVSNMQLSSAQVDKLDMEAYKKSFQFEEMAPQKNKSRLTYPDVYQNTDVRYDLDSNRVKESIIMEAYSSTLRGYRYTLDVGTMIPVLEEDGSITFYDPARENTVMVMPAPYLLDAGNEYNDDIQVQLTGEGSNYVLTYLLPQSWLAEESRQWPVILDPVILADLTTSNIRDITVASKKTYSNMLGSISAGYGNTAGIMRAYLKYRNLPAISSSDVVVAANVRLYMGFAANTQTTVEVHKLNSAWESESITWTNQPTVNSIVEDYAVIGTQQNWYTWEITEIARDWYANQNTGMVFKASNTVEAGASATYKQFFSAEYTDNPIYKPILAIYFRNNNGLESYWDYTASSAGRAGTGYVNHFTGNMVLVRDDIGFGGNRMPVTVSHVYNANDADNNSFGLGLGWRTNYNQLVYQWSADTSYYVWEDSDGTAHYFQHESGSTYKDEDGLELTLTTNGSGTQKYCITDKTGNQSFFDEYGRLRKIQNNQQTKSSINIFYTTTDGKRIDTVTDSIGRYYKFTYTSGLLDQITVKDASDTPFAQVNFTYANSRLTNVTDQDGKYCTYGYNTNGLLSTAQDVDGYKLSYAYHSVSDGSWQPYRVAKISEADGSVEGGVLNITYAHNQTTFTDHNGNVEIHQFNDFGNTVSVQDDEGRAQFAQYDKNTDNAQGGKANQLRLNSKLQNTVGNKIFNGNFEFDIIPWHLNTGGGALSRTTETSYNGNACLKASYTAPTRSIFALGPTFQAEPGKTYIYSAYIKTVGMAVHFGLTNTSTWDTTVGGEVEVDQDWTRVEMIYANTSQQTITFCPAISSGFVGTFYVDCVQIEETAIASRYNLLDNGDFQQGGSPAYGWNGTGLSSNDSVVTIAASAAPQLGKSACKLTGAPTAQKSLFQTVPVSGDANDCFALGGWAKGDSAPLRGDRQFAIIGTFHYTDGDTKDFVAQFNPDVSSNVNWQYSARQMVAEKAYSSITVKLVYDYNVNTVYFDGIQLYKEEFGNSYTYDENGNVISVKDLQKQTTTYEYNTANDLTKVIQNGNAKMTYTYDSHHNVVTAVTEEGLTYSFTYDGYGNNTSVSITQNGVTMSSSATYTDDGNRLETTTDIMGNVTWYEYNALTNVLELALYPETDTPQRSRYYYDSMYRLAEQEFLTHMNELLTVDYAYTDDMLTRLDTLSSTYHFTYGDFGLRTGISVGNRNLATYTYTNDRNRYLSALDYGNGDRVEYTYDKKGRITSETFEDGDTATYTYDNNGVLSKVTDSATGITTTYYYDSTERLMKYVEKGEDHNFTVGYQYDTRNNLTRLVETINGVEHTSDYTYDTDNRITDITNGASAIHHEYDGFGRMYETQTKHNGNTILTQSATYKSPAAGKTGLQVETYTIDSNGYDITYTYTYDARGNISSISDGTNTTTYFYDSADQLIRENNQAGGYTNSWEYDDAGNIICYRKYPYMTDNLQNYEGLYLDEVYYSYNDSQWGDLLTGYDGRTVTSDEIGNMTSDGTWTYTWEHGRNLVSARGTGIAIDYTYDANGMRTSKIVEGVVTTYTYECDRLVHLNRNGDDCYFTYDANGNPATITRGGLTYYYVVNPQGDVVGILNPSGQMVRYYVYDAWGNVIRSGGIYDDSSEVYVYNPFGYRGYIYDDETGLYYLQSRYYNPQLGRFISADGYASTGQGRIGYNMFAYCGNNPTNRFDSSGLFWEEIGKFFLDTGKSIVTAIVLLVALPSASCALIMGKEAHYGRNNYNTVEIETIDQVPDDWTTSNPSKYNDRQKGAPANAHQNTAPSKNKPNTKFSSPDKHEEVIFSYDEKLVVDPVDVGTYNYGTNWVTHWYYDVVPWIWWGNTEDDPSNFWDRAYGFVWGVY